MCIRLLSEDGVRLSAYIIVKTTEELVKTIVSISKDLNEDEYSCYILGDTEETKDQYLARIVVHNISRMTAMVDFVEPSADPLTTDKSVDIFKLYGRNNENSKRSKKRS